MPAADVIVGYPKAPVSARGTYGAPGSMNVAAVTIRWGGVYVTGKPVLEWIAIHRTWVLKGIAALRRNTAPADEVAA